MGRQMKNKLIVLGLIIFTSASFASEGSEMQVGRYLTAKAVPQKTQQDLLSQAIQVRFPQNIQTIGDAMNYLLHFSGYSLVADTKQTAALKITLSKPLPAIDRHFGPMTLKEALLTLAGPAFLLTQDPLNRQINFQLKPQFNRFISEPTDLYHNK